MGFGRVSRVEYHVAALVAYQVFVKCRKQKHVSAAESPGPCVPMQEIFLPAKSDRHQFISKEGNPSAALPYVDSGPPHKVFQ